MKGRVNQDSAFLFATPSIKASEGIYSGHGQEKDWGWGRLKLWLTRTIDGTKHPYRLKIISS